MGVLACDREGCDNIMCDYYSSTYGYLCYDCYNELLEGGFDNIRAFMETPKKEKGSRPYWRTRVEMEFKRR